jgi:hypothetical protein
MGCLDLEQYKKQAVDVAFQGFKSAGNGYVPNGIINKLFELTQPVIDRVMGSTLSPEMGLVKAYDIGFRYLIEVKPLR